MRYAKTFVAAFAVALAVALAVAAAMSAPAPVQDSSTSAIRYPDGTTVYEFDSRGRVTPI